MILTKRHNFDLYLNDTIIIAPRYFETCENIYFVHIVDSYCKRVLLYLNFSFSLCCNKYNVVIYGYFKLYSNSKGLYFNFKKNNHNTRVYICP